MFNVPTLHVPVSLALVVQEIPILSPSTKAPHDKGPPGACFNLTQKPPFRSGPLLRPLFFHARAARALRPPALPIFLKPPAFFFGPATLETVGVPNLVCLDGGRPPPLSRSAAQTRDAVPDKGVLSQTSQPASPKQEAGVTQPDPDPSLTNQPGAV